MALLKNHTKEDKSSFMNSIMDDIFHCNKPICQIISTNAKAHHNEDMFRKYRPLRDTCVDYNISETDTKLDAGLTKIHVKQTQAEYIPYLSDPPPLPPPKKQKYCSGGPPLWEFWDEKWCRKMEKMQRIYHQQFAERVALRKKTERESLMGRHHAMLALAGPEWYQELSPKQLKTVENLKTCILKDLSATVSIHTQDNMAQLGLLPRPKHKYVVNALNNCHKCPVEFLLILYQLINPHRKRYSINDRLLLSAVVHLTMKDTLRELHVRVPSPPSPQKKKKKKQKKTEKVHYKSPYLEPYTFVKQMPEFTGIYSNTHRQYPESPYFSYLEDLKKRKVSNYQPKEQTLPPTVDTEIEEETQYAQTIYEQLVNYRPVRPLLKPSLYRSINSKVKREKEEVYEREEKALLYLQSDEEGEDSNQDEESDIEFSRNVSQNCCEEEIAQIISTQAKEVKETNLTEHVSPLCSNESKTLKEKEVNKCNHIENATKDVQEPQDVTKNEQNYVCECREESKKIIDKPLCQCNRCVKERVNKTTTSVIKGLKETESPETVPVIDAIIAEKSCTCLDNYETKVDQYELYQKRKNLVHHMTKDEEKFIVGGVINTCEGPVPLISGLLPRLECICHEKAKEAEEESRHLANMPHIPQGRIKYQIGGVRETNKGNVYIISQTLPNEPCECSNIVEEFEKEHVTCLELYEAYMQQVKNEIEGFVDEIMSDVKVGKISDQMDKIQETLAAEIIDELVPESTGFQEQLPDLCTCINVKKAFKVNDGCNVLQQCGKNKTVEYKECTCGINIEVPCTDCTCGPPEVIVEEEKEEERQLKRFFIFPKILCNTKWQMNVIKKALSSMADDGYPLAKLPNCHKLPHFKLWMQMRCGKYWTQEDKYASVLISKWMWRHCDSCTVRRVRLPKLKITRDEGHLVNWSKASYCRQLVADGLNKFYTKVRKNTVNFGREFFPTTFSYQFPFSTFRDCFFAYTPSKEEDVLARFVWKKFEYNNMADAKHCGVS